MVTLHQLLDLDYGPEGDRNLQQLLDAGADVNQPAGGDRETPLHVAVRRRRESATEILLRCGARIDARTAGGKTAYVHAARRGFDELATLLLAAGANPQMDPADQFAVAVTSGRLDEARSILQAHPNVVCTGNAEEDRLLADIAGRPDSARVAFLIQAGASLTAPGLDTGTPLHQAAWFGQPANARLLIDAGAPLDVFEPTHECSPLGWAVHGSRYSGGADQRQDAYVQVVRMLLDAGSSLHYPGQPQSAAYLERMRKDASSAVRRLL